MPHSSLTAIGVISGTSMDGIDVSIVETDGDQMVRPGPGQTFPYPDAVRNRLLTLIAEPSRAQSDPLTDLDREVTRRAYRRDSPLHERDRTRQEQCRPDRPARTDGLSPAGGALHPPARIGRAGCRTAWDRHRLPLPPRGCRIRRGRRAVRASLSPRTRRAGFPSP